MNYNYCLREDILFDENGGKYTVYGIDAIELNNKVLQSFPDIFFSRQMGESFVKLCNMCELELIHLADAVEDILTEQYAIYK